MSNRISEHFIAHQFKHTISTIAANSGEITPKVLQGMMGHANFQTTMNTYAGLDTEQMVESSRNLSVKHSQITSKICSKFTIPEGLKTPAPRDFSGI